jgi:DNA-binding transcriptional LysR family regulator
VVAHLLEEPLVVALPKSHQMAKTGRAQPVSLKRLANDPFIMIGPPGTGLHDETVAACREAGFAPRLGQPTPRITSTLCIVDGTKAIPSPAATNPSDIALATPEVG